MTSTAVPAIPVQQAAQQRRLHVAKYLSWSLDHKVIGVQYLFTAFTFFLVGGTLAELIRVNLLAPTGALFIDKSTYNAVFSMHGTIMIFLFIIPTFVGFANYMVPLMIGAKDMAFPWLNAFAFWLIPPAGVLLVLGWIVGPPAAGWTAYFPLSGPVYSPADGQTLWAISIHLLGISSIVGAINFIVTVKNMRTPGMGWFQMPLFVWAMFATSIIVLLGTPFLSGGLTLMLFDRLAGTNIFAPATGGDPLLWPNVFWFYSHPAVYIMVLPGMGILSEVLSVFSRKPIFGYRAIAMSSMAIALLGFMVWGHHMFTSLAPWTRVPFMITSMIIAVPTGIKVFGWLGTIWGGKIRFTAAMHFALGFLSLFVIGGISGVLLASIPVDQQAHGTYFVVAHLHFVLFGGSVFAIMAGAYYWFPKITGRFMNERLGKVHFWLTYVGFLLSFLPMHVSGLYGMPRRVAIYDPKFQVINILTSLGAFILGIGQLPFFVNAAVSFVGGKRAGNNPWNALTLEWTISSPPPEHDFDDDPIPAPDPYGYGTPMAAAYLAGERDIVALNAAMHAGGAHSHTTVESVAGGDK
jgi:cytochrome c oxidase subunit 1